MFEPLVEAADFDQHPVWISWVKHVAYFKVLLQKEYTIPDIVRLDAMQQEAKVCHPRALNHTRALDPHALAIHARPRSTRALDPRAPSIHAPSIHALDLIHTPPVNRKRSLMSRTFGDYVKTKHHFVTHAPVNIMRMGPMSGYHCWSFEGFHQRVKQIGDISNFKNVSKRIVHFFCFSSVAPCSCVRRSASAW